MVESRFYSDTETFPIVPGRLAPDLVCLQHATDRGHVPGQVKIVLAKDALDPLNTALTDPNCLLEFHNGAYDQAVTAAAFPELLPLWFRALAAARGRDTFIRESLILNAKGRLQDNFPKGYFTLGAIAQRRCGIVLDKGEESWRLKYALLANTPVELWPAPAVKYATEDVTSLRAVSEHQRAEALGNPDDEWLQVAAAFVLQLAAVWGVRTDPVAHSTLTNRLTEERDFLERFLSDAGLFRDGSIDQKGVQAAIERACLDAKKPVPKSPSGQTKRDSETIEEVAPNSWELAAVVRRAALVKNLSTYLHPMTLGRTTAMNSRPNVLVASGRTSWGGSKITRTNPWWPELPEGCTYEKVVDVVGTNLQNFPQEAGIRDCIVPRPIKGRNRVLCSTDYDSLELRALGQVSLWIMDRSTFAKGYQSDPDWDPHSYMGGKLIGIDYATALARKGLKEFKDGPRKVGKALNFSLPGGVGAKRFREMAEAAGIDCTFAQAVQYRDEWYAAFPEMADYFEYINYLAESGQVLRQFVSGRLRGHVGYTDGANSFFQGLAADGAKRALFAISMACYCDPSSPLFGCRVIAFIHDEFLLEVWEDTADECAAEVKRLAELHMQYVLPDVPVRATSALATRWVKAMDPCYVDGKMVPWDLSPANQKKCVFPPYRPSTPTSSPESETQIRSRHPSN